MIRILHVVSSLNINAGVMSVIMNYYRHINRNNIQFDFLYFEETAENHLSEITDLGGRTFFISYPTFKHSDQIKLYRFFQDHKGEYTAVHCHPIWASEVVAKSAKSVGIKHVIQHSHSTKYAETKKSAIRNRFLMLFIGHFATDFIACSPESKYLFGKRRVKAGNVYVLPNAIGLDSFTYNYECRNSFRTEFNISDDTLVFGNIGRLAQPKNQLFLLDVFSVIKRIHPNSKLFIVGEGVMRPKIEDKIEALSLSDSVIMTGKRRDIRNVLSGLDIFIMPSIFEGSPVSAIEALTAGLPCLLSDSITRSVDMDGVKYISINDSPEKWAEYALEFWEKRKDHDRNDYHEVIEHGFDIVRQANLLEDYYINLL